MNRLTLRDERLTAGRVLAIDAFRGLTILVMIFVNTLAGVKGMPEWVDHMPADADAMTFVDVVFPAFLFIVGMSIPFALAQRMARGDAGWPLQRHMLGRAVSLLVLGVFMVNAEEGYNEQAMGMSIYSWSLLFYASAILVWNVYRIDNWRVVAGLRLTGVLGLLILALDFRGGADGSLRLAPQWWGILGLIGWAYLYSSIAYHWSKGRLGYLLLALACCVACWCGAHSSLARMEGSSLFFSQADNAAHTSIALSGLITALIFFDEGRVASTRRRFGEALLFAAVLLLAGAALRPAFKISKIYATPTWCLYSAASCIVLFAFVYWLVDLKKVQRWTAFFKPAAANPLLTYIIPYIVYAAMMALHWSWPEVLGAGAPGVLWSAVYALAVMAIVIVLNRLKIRLQL